MNRFILVLRSQLLLNYRSWVMTLLCWAGIIFFFLLFRTDSAQNFYNTFFYGLLYFLGLMLTARSFSGMHEKSQNQAYLLLPASAFEKTLSSLLITTIGFISCLLIYMTLLSFVLEMIFGLLFERPRSFFNPIDMLTDLWFSFPSDFSWPLNMFGGSHLLAFLFVHSLCFLGAAWFKKHSAAKTVCFVLAVLITIFLFIAALFSAAELINWHGRRFFFKDFLREFLAGYIMFTIPLFIISFWTITWLRVREAQASDGI